MPPKEACDTCQALGSTAMSANGTLANCLLSLTEAPKWQYMRQNNTTVRVSIGKLRSHTQRDAGHHKTKKGFQQKKKKKCSNLAPASCLSFPLYGAVPSRPGRNPHSEALQHGNKTTMHSVSCFIWRLSVSLIAVTSVYRCGNDHQNHQ